MKKYAFNEITLLQYIFFIHGTQVGIGVLQLPRELAEKAGTDGWISILIGWVVSLAASILTIQIMKKCPNGTVLELFERYFGRWAAKGLAVVLGAGFGFIAVLIMTRAILFVKAWIMPLTPDYIIMLLLAIPTYLAVRNGVRVLGRYGELVAYLMYVMFPIYFLALKDSHHWLHLFPLLKKGWEPVLTASPATIVSFLGFETAFFLYPFLQKKESATAGIVIANTLSLIVFLFITLSCFLFLSPDEITLYNEPTLNILKVLEFRFLERFEILFMAFYLFVFSTTWMPYMLWSLFCLNWIFGKADISRSTFVFLALLVVYTFFFIPTFNQNDQWQQIYKYFGIGFAFLFPLCLWLYTSIYDRLRKRRTV